MEEYEEVVVILEGSPGRETVALIEHLVSGPPGAIEMRAVLEEEGDYGRV